MLEVTTKMLRDTNAGNYKPKLYGLIRSSLQKSTSFKSEAVIAQTVQMVDISFYQVTAIFPTMLSNGIRGAIIRAGQNLWGDSKAETYMVDAEASGMPIGSYWFYDSRADPKDQAKKWKEILGNHKTPLMCWADYEENYGGTYKGWKQFYNFLEACKREMPDRKFGIYTGYYYWLENSPILPSELNYFAGYPLWLAWYINNPDLVKIPKPWTNLTIWQYTSSGDGTKLGVGSKEIDMNVFNGSLTEYNNYFKLEGEEPMPEITYTANIKSTVTAGAIVRVTPNGADSNQRLTANTRLQITGQPQAAGYYYWYNVVSPVTGWVADVLLDNVLPVPISTEKHLLEVFVDGNLEFSKEF